MSPCASTLPMIFIHFILNYISIIYTLSLPCTPAFQRGDIDVFSYKQLQTGLCKIPKYKPFIIQNSTLQKWRKSTKSKILQAIGNLDVATTSQSSDCSCFNDDTEKCIDYVNSLSFSSANMNQLFARRDESFWHKYEANYRDTTKYFKCIKTERKTMSVDEALMTPKYNDNGLLSNKTSIMFPAPIQRKDLQHLWSDSIPTSEQFIKHQDIYPFFVLFKMKNYLNDVQMMNVWMGSKGYKSTLHFDKTDNLYFMLSGTKNFLLSSPDYSEKFAIYPNLHEFRRQTLFPLNQKDYDNIENDVTIYKNEILFLPKYWYHQVINGESRSMAMNIWVSNGLSMDIQGFQLSKKIRARFQNILKNWPEILYFVQSIKHGYCQKVNKYGNVNCNDPVLMKVYSNTYPVLKEIQRFNQILGDNDHSIFGNDNNKWMTWFIDIDDLLYGYNRNENEVQILEQLLRWRSSANSCPMIDDKSEKIWNAAIKKMMKLLVEINKLHDNDDKHLIGDQVAKGEMSEYIEKILYMLSNEFLLVVAMFIL